MGYTAVHDTLCNDVKIAELTDEDPSIPALFLLVLAASNPWGRLPAHPKLLRARACPLIESWSPEYFEHLIERLVEAGILTRYHCPWRGTECIAVTNYSRYNQSGKQYHRMGKPEYGPPPNWVPPTDLESYLKKVANGTFKRKNLTEEVEKFGVDCVRIGLRASSTPKDHSEGAIPESSHTGTGTTPKDHSEGAIPGSSPDAPQRVPYIDELIQNAAKMLKSREAPKDQSEGVVPKDYSRTQTQTQTQTETETDKRLTTPTMSTPNGRPCAPVGSAQGLNSIPPGPERVQALSDTLSDDLLFEQVNGKRPKDATDKALWDTCKERWLRNAPVILESGEVKHGFGNYRFPGTPARSTAAAEPRG